jgi:hypothetical protein
VLPRRVLSVAELDLANPSIQSATSNLVSDVADLITCVEIQDVAILDPSSVAFPNPLLKLERSYTVNCRYYFMPDILPGSL